jgi:tetratricopeptide (TPR) repeat protein
MHWAYLRLARKKHDAESAERESLALAALKPVKDALLLEAYPHLIHRGHLAEAQTLFDANYNALKAHIAQVGPEAGLLSRLAWICARCHQHLDEAEAAARMAVQQEPANASFLAVLAEVEYRRDRPEEAVRWAEQAAKIDPRDPVIQGNLTQYRAAAKKARPAGKEKE